MPVEIDSCSNCDALCVVCVEIIHTSSEENVKAHESPVKKSRFEVKKNVCSSALPSFLS